MRIYVRMRTLSRCVRPKNGASTCMDWYRRMRTLTRRVHLKKSEVQVRIIEERSLKVREMQERQEYAQTQVSEERRQRDRRLRKGTIATLSIEVDIMETWLRRSISNYEIPRQKQLSIALQRRDSKKPRLWLDLHARLFIPPKGKKSLGTCLFRFGLRNLELFCVT